MPQIRIKTGQQKGKVLQIEGDKPILLGRDPKASLQILDKGVSREHAEIFRVGEMVFIRDLGSRNGTYVNGDQTKEELLREGDVVRIGSTQIIFESTRAARDRDRDVKFEEDSNLKSSLELKVDDLFVDSGKGFSDRAGEQFQALCRATSLLENERSEKKLFEALLDLIQEYLPADHLYLFLYDDESGAILPRAMRQKDPNLGVPVSRTILKRVITESQAILTADAMQDERFKTGDSIVMNQIRSVLCVPVHSATGAVGAIYAVNARIAETFDRSDLELLTSIGTQLGSRLSQTGLLRARQRTFLELTGRLVRLLEQEPSDRPGHAERVGMYAGATAREMGLLDIEVLNSQIAGMLHDLGKLPAVSGLPTTAESGHGSAHVLRGVEFLRELQGMKEVLEGIGAHHEHYDGGGVPKGLQGEAIPLYARIVAVANGFDHLLCGAGKTPPAEPDVATLRSAFTEMEKRAGKEFDPEIVRALLIAYRHGTLSVGPRTGAVDADAQALMEGAEGPTPAQAAPPVEDVEELDAKA